MSTPLDAVWIAGTLTEIEQKLDLAHSDWLEDDIHWWPVYRLELYRRLFLRAAEHDSPAPWRHRSLLGLQAVPRWPGTQGAVWLVSEGSAWQDMGGAGLSERFCTPLADLCRRLGHEAVIVDRGSAHPRLDCSDARYAWIMPAVLRAKLRAAVQARLVPGRRHKALCAQIERIRADLGVDGPLLDPGSMAARCLAISLLARKLERAMRETRPVAVLAVSYYDVAGYACFLAAARAGIPRVDIQHGVTGPLHPAYAGWHRWPPGGYRLLPDWFWCWNAAAAECIDNWADVTSSVRTVIGGNPHTEAWKAGLFEADPAQRQRLAAARLKRDGRPAILVTLQPGLQFEDEIGVLVTWMQQLPDIDWWPRLHPTALDQRAQVLQQLGANASLADTLDMATALPLPVLLMNADLHATHSSSTVIEAADFGVPSLVWSKYGADLFADAISGGMARHVQTVEECAAAIHSLRRRPAASAEPELMRQALQTILGQAA